MDGYRLTPLAGASAERAKGQDDPSDESSEGCGGRCRAVRQRACPALRPGHGDGAFRGSVPGYSMPGMVGAGEVPGAGDAGARWRAVLGDPGVDPLPPVVQPLDLDLVLLRTRYLVERDAPPLGPDERIRGRSRQTSRTVVSPSRPACARKITSASGRAPMAPAPRPAGAPAGSACPARGRQVRPALLFQPLDAVPPAGRRPVAPLGEDQQGAILVQPARQAIDLLGVVCSPRSRRLMNTFGTRLAMTSRLGSTCRPPS